MPPKVSVIIPAYNAAPYIAETLASVFAQSYPDYEVIVVDDGSTDDTLAVLEQFADRITLIRKPNGGPASARNAGLRQARGELLAFLDGDDLWLPDKLAAQVEFCEQHPTAGLVYGEALMFTQDGAEKRIERKIGYTEAPTFWPTFCLLLYGDFIPNSTVVIRRACLERVGYLNEDRALIAVEDYEYWLRIAKYFPIAGLPRPLAYYRLRPGNLMGAGADIEKGLRLSLTVLREIERQFPHLWDECGIKREMLFAKLHIRAGFAWKQQRQWRACLRQYGEALRHSRHWRVFRWLVAASILKRWS